MGISLWILPTSYRVCRVCSMSTALETPKTEAWKPDLTFGDRLVLIRRHVGTNVETLAAQCGLKASTWYSWESGSRPQDLPHVVAAISAATGVDRNWLMWGLPETTDFLISGFVQEALFTASQAA